MNLYVFGSYCRGEIDEYSDIDLLIIKNQDEILPQYDLDKFSIYNLDRIEEMWKEGNPFAWHLFLESKHIFSNNDFDILKQLGEPNVYKNHINDMIKFSKLFDDSKSSLISSIDSIDFDLSMIFLSIRNYASCYALGHLKRPIFTRNTAIELGNDSIQISKECYTILLKSRILSTRGIGSNVSNNDLKVVLNELDSISIWFNNLKTKTNE